MFSRYLLPIELTVNAINLTSIMALYQIIGIISNEFYYVKICAMMELT